MHRRTFDLSHPVIRQHNQIHRQLRILDSLHQLPNLAIQFMHRIGLLRAVRPKAMPRRIGIGKI